ncbi:FkbM family methyltransferase [Afipia sp. DC4300-2b1]|uniref:FkbM family methyltransferase n=1 Tax=Afipia sp. DC4300-2b1 TaxID=2804672 RepID=UPI003CED0CCA
MNAIGAKHVVLESAEDELLPELSVARGASDWRPDWKTQLISQLLKLRRETLIDVGANRGQTLLDYLSVPHAHGYLGFEPNYYCASLVSDIIASARRPDCRIVPAGLSDRNGLQQLLLDPEENLDPSASLDVSLRPGRSWKEQFAACYRFDDIRAALQIGKIGLLKIDVEGAELPVLRGMEASIVKDRPWILCEVLHRDFRAEASDHQLRLDALMSWLSRVDYVCLNVIKSADSLRATELVVMPAIPNKVWTWENAIQCDYLFAPRADTGSLIEALR